MPSHEKNITRKEFLKRSSMGLLSVGLSSSVPSFSMAVTEQKKNYRILGRTGISVSVLGIGASRTMEPKLIEIAFTNGINFLDTGRSYFNGQNEVMLGKIIKGRREKVVVQSKLSMRLNDGQRRNSREEIQKEMERSLTESLKALQTDYLDILLIHGADSINIINDDAILDFFSHAKKNGSIRACGFSCHVNHVELLKNVNKTGLYDVLMIPFNHKGAYKHSRSGRYGEWNQEKLQLELKKAEKNKIGIVAMKTCSAGPYARDGVETPSFYQALNWITNHAYINTMAVAMANITEIEENIKVML